MSVLNDSEEVRKARHYRRLVDELRGISRVVDEIIKDIKKRETEKQQEQETAETASATADFVAGMEQLRKDLDAVGDAAEQDIEEKEKNLEAALTSENPEIKKDAEEIQDNVEQTAEKLKELSEDLGQAYNDIKDTEDVLETLDLAPDAVRESIEGNVLDNGTGGRAGAVSSAAQIAAYFDKNGLNDPHFTDYYTNGGFERDQAQKFKALNSLKKNFVNAMRPVVNNLTPYISCATATTSYLAASAKAERYAINYAVKDSMMNSFRKISNILHESIENAKNVISKTRQFAKDIARSGLKHGNMLLDRLTLGAHSYLNLLSAQKTDKLKNSIGNDTTEIDNNNGGTMSIDVLEYTPFEKFQMRMNEMSSKLHNTDEQAYWKEVHDQTWKNGKSPVEHVIDAFVSAREKTSFENIKKCINEKSTELKQKLEDKKQAIVSSVKAADAAVKNFPRNIAKKTVDGINTLRANTLVNEARLYAKMADTHVQTMNIYENKYQKLYAADMEIQSQMEKIRETLAKLSPDYEAKKYIPKPYDSSAMIAAGNALYAQFQSNDITIGQFAKAFNALNADWKKEEGNFTEAERKKAAIFDALQKKLAVLDAKHGLFKNRMDMVAAKCLREEEKANNIINNHINSRFDKASELNTQRDYNQLDNVSANVPHGNNDNSDSFSDEAFDMA